MSSLLKTVGLSEASFVSAESGENVTLHCKIKEKSDQSVKSWVWYKQSAGQEPQEVAVKLIGKLPNTLSEKFKINQRFDLTIEHTNETDEGMYFCGKGHMNTIKFSKGTFLAMKGNNLPFYISLTYTPCSRSLCSARSSLRSEQQISECSGSELLQDNPFLKSFTLIRTAAAVSVRSALLQAALCMSSLRTSSTSTTLELITALWLLVGRSLLGMEHQ
uniref:Ig-like domain-containing protein n=1 Tax=Pygocentrus nattereri TaxID=42514 RepID=A0A3B4C194_PYGNA